MRMHRAGDTHPHLHSLRPCSSDRAVKVVGAKARPSRRHTSIHSNYQCSRQAQVGWATAINCPAQARRYGTPAYDVTVRRILKDSDKFTLGHASSASRHRTPGCGCQVRCTGAFDHNAPRWKVTQRPAAPAAVSQAPGLSGGSFAVRPAGVRDLSCKFRLAEQLGRCFVALTNENPSLSILGFTTNGYFK